MPLSTEALRGRNSGSSPDVKRSIAALTAGSPQASTNITSSRYGIQARNTSPAGCCFRATVIGLSSGSRRMFLGFHTLSTNTIVTMHASELRMSVSSGPM